MLITVNTLRHRDSLYFLWGKNLQCNVEHWNKVSFTNIITKGKYSQIQSKWYWLVVQLIILPMGFHPNWAGRFETATMIFFMRLAWHCITIWVSGARQYTQKSYRDLSPNLIQKWWWKYMPLKLFSNPTSPFKVTS